MDPKKGMYSNAMSKPIQGGMMGAASGMMGGAQDQNQVAPQSNLRGLNYHPSHLNALHHMGKAASEYLQVSDPLPSESSYRLEKFRQRLHPRAHRQPSPFMDLRYGCLSKHARSCACCTC